jgi:hypothetical protein
MQEGGPIDVVANAEGDSNEECPQKKRYAKVPDCRD